MIVRSEFIADVVDESRNDEFFVGAVPQRAGRRLQRMLEAAYGIPFERMIELLERCQYGVRQSARVLALGFIQQLIVLAGAVLHAPETHDFVHRYPSSVIWRS